MKLPFMHDKSPFMNFLFRFNRLLIFTRFAGESLGSDAAREITTLIGFDFDVD